MMPEAEGGMPMMRMVMGQEGIRMMAEHIEGRLAFLKTELRITNEQLHLWNTPSRKLCGITRRRCRPCRTR
jgi:hypothetical protein